MLRNTFTAALLAVMLVAFVVGNVQAQTPTATVTASATIRAALTILEVANVDFGSVARLTTPVLNAHGISSSSYVGTGAIIGQVTITLQAGASIHVTWPASFLLNGPSSSTILYTLAVNGDDGGTNQSGAGSVSSPLDVAPTNSTYVLWIGGTLGAIGGGQTTGAYTNASAGVFTVEYN